MFFFHILNEFGHLSELVIEDLLWSECSQLCSYDSVSKDSGLILNEVQEGMHFQ